MAFSSKKIILTHLLVSSLFFPFSFSQTSNNSLKLKENALFSNPLNTRSVESNAVFSTQEHRARLVQLNNIEDLSSMDFNQVLIFNLFDDVTLPVQLERKEGSYVNGLEVWIGRTPDVRFDHLKQYKNTVVVVNPKTNKMVAHIQSEKGYYQILPTQNKGEYRIRDYKDEPIQCDLLTDKLAKLNHPENKLMLRSNCGNACYNETDANGKYVFDVFMGFSTSAATAAGDIAAYAQAQVETVNMGLTNSLVTTGYMRLVGTGTTTNNPGIVTSVLSDCYTWFAAQIAALAPDFVTVYQTSTGATNEAGGWAGVGDYSNVNDIALPSAFRHEMGHNVGGGHCVGDGSVFPYAHGYDNGNWKTHLCGNSVNFYSNPLINDNLGNPIGDAASANMARAWRERAAEMAQKSNHKVAYFAGDACVNSICLPSHFGSQDELIKQVVFNTINNNQSAPGWTCTTTTGYSDFTNLSTNVVRNTSYPITITPNFSFAESKVSVWIDWNKNNTFEATEQVGNFAGLGPWTTSVTVPPTAQIGNITLRIRLQYGTTYTPTPCGGSPYSSGETEDYTLTVAVVLPVELLDFKGENTEGGNFLTWQTASENNNHGFEIQRSNSGQDFETIGFVEGKGNSNQTQSYTFNDAKPYLGVNFYRLKQMDKDKKATLSNTIALSKELKTRLIYPNPTKGEIWIEQSPTASTKVMIVNTLGQVVKNLNLNSNNLTIADLPNGVYYITISTNNQSETQRIIKQ